MGWANCGLDSRGRRIGYAVPATCDQPGCKAKIDRGLSYACGDMHGSSDGCEGYFCGDHLTHRYDPVDEHGKQFCASCAANLDEQRVEDFTRALTEILLSEDGVATARDALARWDELPREDAWSALRVLQPHNPPADGDRSQEDPKTAPGHGEGGEDV